MIIGEAAGTAAAAAFKNKTTVQQLNPTEVQKTLVESGARVYLPPGPAPAPAAYVVSGAGLEEVNGVYQVCEDHFFILTKQSVTSRTTIDVHTTTIVLYCTCTRMLDSWTDIFTGMRERSCT